MAAASAFLPAQRRPCAGAAHSRSAGLRPPGVDGSAATNGSVRCPAVPRHRPAAFDRGDPPDLARIEPLLDGHLPSPAELLGVDPASRREAGRSWRKINTLRDLAERLSDGRL